MEAYHSGLSEGVHQIVREFRVWQPIWRFVERLTVNLVSH